MNGRVEGSFRDPSGYLFVQNDVLLRRVNASYAEHYEHLIESGLYAELTAAGLLIPHEEQTIADGDDAYRILRPELVGQISYPYEWSFGQLRDAALLTLKIQRMAFAKGMILKDATAYNVQFHKGKPVFIDTLSFEKYTEGKPWVAYRQFCQHFLAPLALMSYVDVNMSQLLRTNIDGIPLPLATSMLPARTKLKPGLLMHMWVHSKSQVSATRDQRDTDSAQSGKGGASRQFSKTAFLGLIDSLEGTVGKLSWKPGGSEWFDYYEANNNYSGSGLDYKEDLVSKFVAQVGPKTVWDMGGNTGRFSRLAAKEGAAVVCWDIDPGCVEANYQQTRAQKENSILPLLCDLSNPSPSIGWANAERMSVAERGPVDMVMALGLIHHLTISNNVPLGTVAGFFQQLGQWLLIEFVPRGDSQVVKLLQTRKDIHDDYTEEGFEAAFSAFFDITEKTPVPETKRTLYLMHAKTAIMGTSDHEGPHGGDSCA